MDRKTLLAIALCLIIFVGWQKFILESKFSPASSTVETTSIPTGTLPPATSQNTVSPHATLELKTHPPKKMPPQTQTLQTSAGEVTLSDTGQIVLDWKLKHYRTTIAPNSPAIDLQSVTHQLGAITLAFDDTELSYLPEAQGSFASQDQQNTWSYQDAQVKISRVITHHPDQPYLDIRIQTEFLRKTPKFAFLYLNAQSFDKDPEAQDRQLAYWTNQSIERITLKDSLEQKEITTPLKYIAAINRYFILALVADPSTSPSGLIQPTQLHGGRLSLVYPITGNRINIPVRAYFGPKELNLLRQVEPTLDHTVDFGWFTLFAYPLLKILKWFYQFVHNYGVAIILLTLLLKIATYPLTYKSMKSMKKMAKLQPQLQKMREKHKDDKEALNREMLTMMKSHGYNPMAGCLPMVVQMPIFFALYRVLYSSIELYHAPFMLWIHDLSSHDPFYVTPVLLSVTMFIQQKLTPNTATDPAQAKMMQLMPLIFGAFMLALPSGLTLYMLVNAIASIAQQMILNKKLDPA
jgi:YidC/Oxa1 family membrane protein insertase